MSNLVTKKHLNFFFYQQKSCRRHFFFNKQQKYIYSLYRFYARVFFELNNVFLTKSFLLFFFNIFMKKGKKIDCNKHLNAFLIFFKQFQGRDPLEIFYFWSFYYSIPAQLFRYKLGQYRKAKVIEFLHQHMGSGPLSAWFHFFKNNLSLGVKSLFFVMCNSFFYSLYLQDSSPLIQNRKEHLKRLVFGINYLYNAKFVGYKVFRIVWKKRKHVDFMYKKVYGFNYIKFLLFVNLFKILFKPQFFNKHSKIYKFEIVR